MGLDNFFDNNNTDFNNTDFNANDDILSKLSTPLKAIQEPEIDDYDDDGIDKGEGSGNDSAEDTVTIEEKQEQKKRFKRLNKLGSKGIVKALDLGNANLCKKIAMSDDATQYRAEKEDIDDLQEVLEEILPNKGGEKLNIPVWVQVVIYILIAFLPSIILAFSDRTDNREVKRLQKELDVLKKERELQKIRQEMAKETPDEKKIDEMMMNAANGKGVTTDEEYENNVEETY